MTDLVLSIAHHLLVFTMLGALVAEFALLGSTVSARIVRRLSLLDLTYGAVATAVVAVGFLRVYYGAKGPDFFLHNHAFWAKLTVFVVIALLSLPPTLRILGWRRRLQRDPAFAPTQDEVRCMRRFMLAELALFPLIPAFAAAMVRGYGAV